MGGTSQSIQEVLSEVDKDGDGRIDYEEFCNMMRGTENNDPLGQRKSGLRKGIF